MQYVSPNLVQEVVEKIVSTPEMNQEELRQTTDSFLSEVKTHGPIYPEFIDVVLSIKSKGAAFSEVQRDFGKVASDMAEKQLAPFKPVFQKLESSIREGISTKEEKDLSMDLPAPQGRALEVQEKSPERTTIGSVGGFKVGSPVIISSDNSRLGGKPHSVFESQQNGIPNVFEIQELKWARLEDKIRDLKNIPENQHLTVENITEVAYTDRETVDYDFTIPVNHLHLFPDYKNPAYDLAFIYQLGFYETEILRILFKNHRQYGYAETYRALYLAKLMRWGYWNRTEEQFPGCGAKELSNYSDTNNEILKLDGLRFKVYSSIIAYAQFGQTRKVALLEIVKDLESLLHYYQNRTLDGKYSVSENYAE